MSTDPMPDDPRISAAWTNLIGSAVRTGQIRIVDDKPADPIDLDAIERMTRNSHDPVMALQARALVAEVRRLRGELDHWRLRAQTAERLLTELGWQRNLTPGQALWTPAGEAAMSDVLIDRRIALCKLAAAGDVEVPGQDSQDDREPPYHFGEMEQR